MKSNFTIPLSLSVPPFLEAWDQWLQDRRERQKPVTSRAALLQLRKLETMGPALAVKSIEQSIERGYTGLFEPIPERNGHAVSAPKPTPFNLKTQIENIDSKMKELRFRGGNEVAGGFCWNDEKLRREFLDLKKRRQQKSDELLNL